MLILNDANKYDALKMRYKDQVELLRNIANNDLRIFSGYLTLQVALGAWLTTNRPTETIYGIGLMVIDVMLAFIVSMLLYYDSKRRNEVVKTVKNINSVLGFEIPDMYQQGITINAPTKYKPWFIPYIVGVYISVCGVGLMLFGKM